MLQSNSDSKKLSQLSRSPSITTDLGYHTLVESHALIPSFSLNNDNTHVKEFAASESNTQSLSKHNYSTKSHEICHFDHLTDDIVIKIFSFLSTNELCSLCTRVCRRWYYLSWDPILWQSLVFNTQNCHNLNIDRVLKTLLKLLSRDFYCREKVPSSKETYFYAYSSNDASFINSLKYCKFSLPIERIVLNGCTQLTDRGLSLIARKCGYRVRSLEIRGCTYVTSLGLNEILTKCVNLDKLDLTGESTIRVCHCLTGGVLNFTFIGCSNVTVSSSHFHEHQTKLRCLDLSYCFQLDDYTLKTLLKLYGRRLTHLYIRGCTLLTDQAIKSVATYCPLLRELSVNDCAQLTDYVCFQLSSRLSANLRYLSVAKCEQITDFGLKQIAQYCSKLRYLNVRGCTTISDEGVVVLIQSCGPRLRAIDVGKSNVTDGGLKILSENCPNLRKLSVKGCDGVSDAGIMFVAYYCRALILINIANCNNVTIESYHHIKKYCKRCTILA